MQGQQQQSKIVFIDSQTGQPIEHYQESRLSGRTQQAQIYPRPVDQNESLNQMGRMAFGIGCALIVGIFGALMLGFLMQVILTPRTPDPQVIEINPDCVLFCSGKN